jgi:uncharacterized membrane protein YedE/YeeE
MKRQLFSALAGAIFGVGLLASGMTDTTKVQGWLDVFGAWDPTLAFVLGGAILPMAVAWRMARKQQAPRLGGTFPHPPSPQLDVRLVTGSSLFGLGWGLTGLCPGPAMASLGFGGVGGLVFFAAMIAGMMAAPYLSRSLQPES